MNNTFRCALAGVGSCGSSVMADTLRRGSSMVHEPLEKAPDWRWHETSSGGRAGPSERERVHGGERFGCVADETARSGRPNTRLDALGFIRRVGPEMIFISLKAPGEPLTLTWFRKVARDPALKDGRIDAYQPGEVLEVKSASPDRLCKTDVCHRPILPKSDSTTISISEQRGG